MGRESPWTGRKSSGGRESGSGKAEEIHHILKEELGGGHVPSKRFGANAAWWTIAVLALNLHNLMKGILAGGVWKKQAEKHPVSPLHHGGKDSETRKADRAENPDGRPGRDALCLCHEETGAAAVHAGLKKSGAVP